MIPKKYILWIEDDAAYNLQRLAIPIVMHRDYDLTLAVTISEAIHFLQRQTYDAIIVDLRMPPGRERHWIKLDQRLAHAGEPPRLGLHLLLNLFDRPQTNGKIDLHDVRKHSIQKFGILSIDPMTAVQNQLQDINFDENHYKQKTAGMDSSILLQLVRTITTK